jgi:pilus assembly protein CpaB
MRPNLVLIFGLIASTLTAVVVYHSVERPSGPVAPAPRAQATNPVVIAASEVPIGTALEAKHLRTIEWPAAAMPANVHPAPEALVGRVTITRLVANEPLTDDKLAPVGTKGLLALVIEPGMRAVTVKVNEVTAVGGFIAPGSRVDVLLTGNVRLPAEVPSGSGGRTDVEAVSEQRTRTLLQNVTVLALGQLLEQNDAKPPGNLTTATLLVTPDNAELLALAEAAGSLQLMLRSFADNDAITSHGKGVTDLFALPSHAPVMVPDIATEHIELIRGAERVVLSF